MDKIINSHIDKIDEIKRQVDLVIEQEILSVKIKDIIDDPRGALDQVVENIDRVYMDRYADQAIELGFEFGRVVKKKIEDDKTIKVDKSKNPQLNADS